MAFRAPQTALRRHIRHATQPSAGLAGTVDQARPVAGAGKHGGVDYDERSSLGEGPYESTHHVDVARAQAHGQLPMERDREPEGCTGWAGRYARDAWMRPASSQATDTTGSKDRLFRRAPANRSITDFGFTPDPPAPARRACAHLAPRARARRQYWCRWITLDYDARVARDGATLPQGTLDQTIPKLIRFRTGAPDFNMAKPSLICSSFTWPEIR